jgi:hypothetical protein
MNAQSDILKMNFKALGKKKKEGRQNLVQRG